MFHRFLLWLATSVGSVIVACRARSRSTGCASILDYLFFTSWLPGHVTMAIACVAGIFRHRGQDSRGEVG